MSASDFEALAAMVYRQVKRWATSKSRVLSVIVQPLLWLAFLGVGFGSIFSPDNLNVLPGGNATTTSVSPTALKAVLSRYFTSIFGGVDYMTFIVTGMAAVVAFIGSFIAGISVIWDKQFGFLKETLVAPASRKSVIFGRMLGDSIVNTLQSLIIMLLALLISTKVRVLGIPIALAYIFLMSLGFTGLGIAMSLKFSSMEGFQMIINLITMPLIFMSGTFFPIGTAPTWMKAAALANPLTYAIYGVRYWLTGAAESFSFINPVTSIVALAVFTLISTVIAMKLFEGASLED